jgi:hypothetical protein
MLMTTKERNRRRKIKKKAELAQDHGISSDSGAYLWKRFDTMTYKRRVKK